MSEYEALHKAMTSVEGKIEVNYMQVESSLNVKSLSLQYSSQGHNRPL